MRKYRVYMNHFKYVEVLAFDAGRAYMAKRNLSPEWDAEMIVVDMFTGEVRKFRTLMSGKVVCK